MARIITRTAKIITLIAWVAFASAAGIVASRSGANPAVLTPAATVASVTACKTTHTGTTTTTSAGNFTSRYTVKITCGHDYRKWDYVTERSHTGSHYTEHVYRDEMNYPHYTQTAVKDSVSAKGVRTHTVKITSG